MSTVAALALEIGPWALLVVLIVVSAAAPYLVRLVLNKSVPITEDRDVSVRVRMFGWLRVEIEVKAPHAEMPREHGTRSGDPPPADVIPIQDDAH